mgnify:CR=1 FL=1
MTRKKDKIKITITIIIIIIIIAVRMTLVKGINFYKKRLTIFCQIFEVSLEIERHE